MERKNGFRSLRPRKRHSDSKKTVAGAACAGKVFCAAMTLTGPHTAQTQIAFFTMVPIAFGAGKQG